tara:strand:+ start:24141 stop:24662 length:522 start_codon:yes stop_codon:yes gene_type:complete
MALQIAYATELISSDHVLWPNQLPVPNHIAEEFRKANIARVKCQVKTIEWQCSIIKEVDFYYIMLNQQRIKSFCLSPGEPVEVILTEDTTQYGADMPTTLISELELNTEAKTFFEALTPGKIRTLIHLVAKVKSIDGQQKKARAIVHHLIEWNGKLDFKALNETIKLYNKGLL